MKTLTATQTATISGGQDPWYDQYIVTPITYLLGGYKVQALNN